MSLHYMSSEQEAKLKNVIELLLQVVELFPDAANHVEQYIPQGQLATFQEEMKQIHEKGAL